MKILKLVRSSGQGQEFPLDQVIFIEKLSQVAQLRLIGKEAFWFTWVKGKIEKLNHRPAILDRYVVKVLASGNEEVALTCEQFYVR